MKTRGNERQSAYLWAKNFGYKRKHDIFPCCFIIQRICCCFYVSSYTDNASLEISASVSVTVTFSCSVQFQFSSVRFCFFFSFSDPAHYLTHLMLSKVTLFTFYIPIRVSVRGIFRQGWQDGFWFGAAKAKFRNIFILFFHSCRSLFRLRFNQFAGVELFWGEVAKRWAEKLMNFGGKRFWGLTVSPEFWRCVKIILFPPFAHFAEFSILICVCMYVCILSCPASQL